MAFQPFGAVRGWGYLWKWLFYLAATFKMSELLAKMGDPTELESKMDGLKQRDGMKVEVSPSSSSIDEKRKELGTAEEFQFEIVDPVYSTGINLPARYDVEVASCVVRGQIPPEIDGTFYRVTCDYIFANRNKKDIWINGDGAVNAWRISNGVVDFKQKFVRTPRFIIERAARKPLFGTYRNPFAGDPRVFEVIQSTGNTHVVYWNSQLLVLKEDSPPLNVDPDSLDTIGIYDFEGQLNSKTFCAHPKIDQSTGEMMAFGMEGKEFVGNDLVYYRFDRDGSKLDECWVKTPIVTWTHDMGATNNYVIFGMTPMEADLEYMKSANGTHFRFNRFLPNTFGVLPRRNPKPEDVRWFTTVKNHFWGHIANVFEDEDGNIYIDTYLSDGDALGVFPNMHPELGAGKPRPQIIAKLVRLKIDPKAESTEMELPTVLSEIPGEMARCDDRFTTKLYRYLFSASFGPGGMTGIAKVDLVTGVTYVWNAGNGITCGEPCFIPRSAASPEGDGWLLVCCRDSKTTLACLVILDATDLLAGPVSVIELPLRLREGVHGSWVPASDLPGRNPLVDYSGVTPEIMAKFGSGSPKPFDDHNFRRIRMVLLVEQAWDCPCREPPTAWSPFSQTWVKAMGAPAWTHEK